MLKGISIVKIRQNLLKYWFALCHFDLDYPVKKSMLIMDAPFQNMSEWWATTKAIIIFYTYPYDKGLFLGIYNRLFQKYTYNLPYV